MYVLLCVLKYFITSFFLVCVCNLAANQRNIRKSLLDMESDLIQQSAPEQPSVLQGAASYVNHGEFFFFYDKNVPAAVLICLTHVVLFCFVFCQFCF